MIREILRLALILTSTLLISCGEPAKQLTLSDIKIPDPEGDLAKHLGIMAVEEVGACEYRHYGSDDISDTLTTSVYYPDGKLRYVITFNMTTKKTSYKYDEEGYLMQLVRPYNDGDVCFNYSVDQEKNELTCEISDYSAYDNICKGEWAEFERSKFDRNGTIQESLIMGKVGRQYYYDSLGRMVCKLQYDLPEYHKFARYRYPNGRDVWITSTYYYYRGKGVLLDSVVQRCFDKNGIDQQAGFQQYFDRKGYPMLKRYDLRGDVYLMRCVLYSEEQAEAYLKACIELPRGSGCAF